MKKKGLGQLALAKQLADESGRRVSECMAEAADMIFREQNEVRVPGVRIFYALLVIVFSILTLTGIGQMTGTWQPSQPDWFGLLTLGIALVGIFWIAPELPLMSNLWSRWNTPVFIALMAISLLIDPKTAGALVGAAKAGYFGLAIVAAANGLKDPYLALDRRIYTSPLFFRKLSPRDQARLFFLAAWLDPFHFRVGR